MIGTIIFGTVVSILYPELKMLTVVERIVFIVMLPVFYFWNVAFHEYLHWSALKAFGISADVNIEPFKKGANFCQPLGDLTASQIIIASLTPLIISGILAYLVFFFFSTSFIKVLMSWLFTLSALGSLGDLDYSYTAIKHGSKNRLFRDLGVKLEVYELTEW